MYIPIVLGARMGMRMGETAGLRWKDIDFKEKTLTLCGQVQYIKGKGVTWTTLKTASSYRTVPIPPSVLAVLAEAKLKATGEYVCTKDGKMIPSKKHPKFFAQVATNAGFLPVDKGGNGVPSHSSLRTTFVSFLNSKGMSTRTIADLVGHGSTRTTEAHYVKSSVDEREEAMKLIG
jgi:integrase